MNKLLKMKDEIMETISRILPQNKLLKNIPAIYERIPQRITRGVP